MRPDVPIGKSLLIILLTLTGPSLLATHPQFRHFTVENGLNSNTIHCIFQDSKGLMWFGTHDGLTTYDTYHFKTWRHHPDEPTSIGNNTIYDIFEDKDGTMWIGTEQGLWYMNSTDESFHQLAPETGTCSVMVYSIQQDRQERIWISTLDAGIFCYDKSVDKAWNWRKGSVNSSFQSDYAPKILIDPEENLWCLTSGNCLYQFDYSSNKFKSILIRDQKKGIEEKNAYTMMLDQNNHLWIGGWDSGLFEYDPKTGVFTNYLVDRHRPRIKGRIHSLIEFRPGLIMLGSDSGLSLYKVATDELDTISYDKTRREGISDNFIHDIYKDHEGGIWLATYFGGINYIGPNSSNFHFMSCENEASSGRVISRLYEDFDHNILIGTDDGGLFKYYPQEEKVNKILCHPEYYNLNIHALLADEEFIWVGTYSNGLFQINRHTHQSRHFLQFTEEGNPNFRESVYSINKDQKGDIWIGTKSAIYHYHDQKFTLMKKLDHNSDIIEICPDHEDNLWFASITKGLFKYDRKTQQIQNCDIRAFSDQVKIKEITAMAIIEDKIWMGTAGRGIITYDLNSGKSQSLWTSDDFHAKLTITQIVNADEYVWTSTNKGLMRYDKENGNIDFFNQSDGLYTDIFNQNSGIYTSDGTLYFGANGGFNFFKQDQLTINQTVPHVHFNSLTLYKNKNASNQSSNHTWNHKIDPQKEIRIEHGFTFSINYAALSYISPQRNNYQYKLEGYDHQWTLLDNESNSISYANLPIGRYRFRIKACNNDRLWGPESTLDIRITPHWWETPFAVSLYILFFIGSTIGITYIIRNNRMQRKLRKAERKKHEMEQVRSETELDFFTDLAHEIRTPVMLISSPINEMMTREELPEDIQDNIILMKRSSDKLMNLTDDLLNFRRISNDSLTKTNFKGIGFILENVNEFQPLAHNLGIDLKIDNQISDDLIIHSNKNALNKIISNLLTNAFKFTRSLILIRLYRQDNLLYVSIYDNGTGIAEKNQAEIFKAFKHYDKPGNEKIQGFGLGLSISNMLASKLGIKIEVKSEENRYCQFTLQIPISKLKLEEYEQSQQTHEDNFSKETKKKTKDKTKNPTILIVDDDKDLRDYIARSLDDQFETYTAKDGIQAYNMLKEGLYCDLIICDVVMPNMDGVELCRQLKNDLNFCHIPIVLLSANTSKDLISLGVENGADLYLIKPIDIPLMILQIKNLLEKNKKLWDSFSKRPFLSMQSFSNDDSDQLFIKNVSDIILENLSNFDFTVNDLAEQMNLSRSVLFLKIKEIAGMTPNNFIKTFRLRKAAEMLAEGKYKVNEICYMTGFNTPSYFSKCFFETFGMLPKNFINNLKQ